MQDDDRVWENRLRVQIPPSNNISLRSINFSDFKDLDGNSVKISDIKKREHRLEKTLKTIEGEAIINQEEVGNMSDHQVLINNRYIEIEPEPEQKEQLIED